MSTSIKPTRPPLRYHGGKWRVADKLIPYFPKHITYVEPFGGGASVLLQKSRSKNEIYNDLDSDVVNMFQVLRDQEKKEKLLQLLELTPFAREEMKLAWEETDCPIEQARRIIVRSHMGFGSAGATKARTGFRGLDRCDNSFSAPAKQWERLPSALSTVCERLKGVVIENKPAVDIIELADGESTFFYMDPPYLPETRSSMKGGQKYYRHEMTKWEHRQLLKKIRTLKGKVIISGYDSKLYNLYLKDWKKVSFNARASSSAGTVIRQEVIWISPNIDTNTLF